VFDLMKILFVSYHSLKDRSSGAADQTNPVAASYFIIGGASPVGPTVNVWVAGTTPEPGSPLGWADPNGVLLHHTTIDDDTRVRTRILTGYGGPGPAPRP
jgi:hypothetical protein